LISRLIKPLDPGADEQLRIELIGDEAVKTSAIEGEILDRESVQSSLLRQFGLQTDDRRIPPGEQGIAGMMVDLYRTYDQLNPRQEKALLRMFEAGLGGFKGGMSSEKYIRITSTSRATATRDLHDLVERVRSFAAAS
jgi:Fic family protein